MEYVIVFVLRERIKIMGNVLDVCRGKYGMVRIVYIIRRNVHRECIGMGLLVLVMCLLALKGNIGTAPVA